MKHSVIATKYVKEIKINILIIAVFEPVLGITDLKNGNSERFH